MKKVLLMDSGSGGINVLKECVKVCPYCDFLMFCDVVNLPYGQKLKEELQSLTLNNLRNIRRFFKFDIVIFACNTLSCTCLEIARATFEDVVFIGTVPAVKPALEKYDESEILVIATSATIQHNISINKHNAIMKKSLPNLASDIDMHLDELEVLKPNLKSELESYKPKAVVLGCTHYVAILPFLKEIFGEGVEFFDSANGVARRLLHFVADEESSYQVQIMTSGDEKNLAKFWWWFFKDCEI